VAAEPAGEENVVGALPGDSELRLPAGKEADVIEVMTSLADELGAEAVVLMRGPHVLTSVGQIGDGAMKHLADIMAEGFRASDRVASLLGCSQGCLEHIVDIGDFLIHALAIDGDLVISTAMPSRVPLGSARLWAKRSAAQMEDIVREWEEL
jgi:predicted regulator of Ras-like GTPase activity (Roadblock/LC7/MglB family)